MSGAEGIITGFCIIFAFVGGMITGANVEMKSTEYERRSRENRARKRRENTRDEG